MLTHISDCLTQAIHYNNVRAVKYFIDNYETNLSLRELKTLLSYSLIHPNSGIVRLLVDTINNRGLDSLKYLVDRDIFSTTNNIFLTTIKYLLIHNLFETAASLIIDISKRLVYREQILFIAMNTQNIANIINVLNAIEYNINDYLTVISASISKNYVDILEYLLG